MDDTTNPAMSGLTVLQVIPELETGGAERTTIDIARAISQAGGTALVASQGGQMAAELEEAGGRLIQLPVKSKNPLVMGLNALRLFKVIRDHGVDIVHARSRAPAWSALWAAKLARATFLTTYHGTYQAKSRLKRYYNSVMARGELVIANSQFIGNHIVSEHGAAPDRVRVVHRGSDLDRLRPDNIGSERLDHLRDSWGIRDNLPIILLPGRLTRWKGQEVFVEAMSELQKLGDESFHGVMIGEAQGRDDYVSGLVSSIRMRGLSKCVQVPGRCDDWPAAFAVADIVVSASIEPEAFGRVAVEAQAMEKPVVATDHGGARETVIVGEGATGWLVSPGDPKELALTLKQVLDLRPEERATIGRRGRDNAERHFSVRTMCDKTLGVYLELWKK